MRAGYGAGEGVGTVSNERPCAICGDTFGGNLAVGSMICGECIDRAVPQMREAQPTRRVFGLSPDATRRLLQQVDAAGVCVMPPGVALEWVVPAAPVPRDDEVDRSIAVAIVGIKP